MTTLRCALGCVLCLILASQLHGADKERKKTTEFKLEQGRLVLPGPVLFKAGTDEILEESEEPLWVVVDYLEAKTYITLMRVEGHTDDGDPAKSQDLSERRALAVARWLVKHGVDCKRLIAVGFGSTKPVAANDSPEGKAKNRRMEFVNASLRGKPIGGMPVDGGGKVAGDPCK